MIKPLNKSVLTLIHKFRGTPVSFWRNQFEKSQWFQKNEFEKLQFHALNRVIQSSRKIPYYKNAFHNLSVTQGKINHLTQFDKFPQLGKSELQQLYTEFSSKTDSKHHVIETRKTSGTSGFPIKIPAGRETVARALACRDRFQAWYGIKPGDRQARFWGRPVNSATNGKNKLRNWLLNRIVFSPEKLGYESFNRWTAQLCKLKPDFFYGYSSMLAAYANHLASSREKLNFTPKAVICTAEMISRPEKKQMENIYDCPVIEEYGCSEVDIIAFECEYGSLHIAEDNVLVEVVDKDSEGYGNVLVTDLSNTIFPLVKYKLDDIARLENVTCNCRRQLQIMSPVLGRDQNQYILHPEGTLIHSVVIPDTIEHVCKKLKVEITWFKASQFKDYRLLLKLAASKNGNHVTDKELVDTVRKEITAVLGTSIPVEIILQTTPDDIKAGRKTSYFEICR